MQYNPYYVSLDKFRGGIRYSVSANSYVIWTSEKTDDPKGPSYREWPPAYGDGVTAAAALDQKILELEFQNASN